LAKADGLYQAQQIMYSAWESPEPKRRIALAQQALDISPDCAREDGFDEVSRNNAPEVESIRATVDALVAHDVPR
jgi:hypothetical protein